MCAHSVAMKPRPASVEGEVVPDAVDHTESRSHVSLEATRVVLKQAW